MFSPWTPHVSNAWSSHVSNASRPEGESAFRVEASGDPRRPCWRILRKEGVGKLKSGDKVPWGFNHGGSTNTLRIHGAGIFTYIGIIWKIPLGVNVGKYSSTMDPLGIWIALRIP